MSRRVERSKYLLREIYNKPHPVPVKEERKPKWRKLDTVLAHTNFISPTGCMEWKGCTNPVTGYATLNMDQRTWLVHRYVAFYYYIKHPGWRNFLMSKRSIVVCHTCDNPPCINPEHLLIATAQYNTWDAITKGRHRNKYNAEFDINNVDMYDGLIKTFLS